MTDRLMDRRGLTRIAAALALVATIPAAKAAEPSPDLLGIIYDGAPRWGDKDGWSLKLRGRVQYDFGYVERPAGVTRDDLGWTDELRRLRLGFEATTPGGVGVKVEGDFAEDEFELNDAVLTYAPAKGVVLTAGQHNNFQSIEELTSSRFTSFIERAAFTDAFGFERRIGLSARHLKGPLLVTGGVFTDNFHELDDRAGTPVGADMRIVYLPKLTGAQLHFGASAHYSDFDAEDGVPIRYRQRPQVHSTDARFVATPRIPVTAELSYGLEAAVIRGPFHAAGEVHWLQPDGLTPGDPALFGGYAEMGVFLTGETRGYKAGQFDRTRPQRPLGRGGFGAVQLNARYDRLDLGGGPWGGGTQDALLASLVWIPTGHIRLTTNYGHLMFEDAAIAAAGGNLDYSVDIAGIRLQYDF